MYKTWTNSISITCICKKCTFLGTTTNLLTQTGQGWDPASRWFWCMLKFENNCDGLFLTKVFQSINKTCVSGFLIIFYVIKSGWQHFAVSDEFLMKKLFLSTLVHLWPLSPWIIVKILFPTCYFPLWYAVIIFNNINCKLPSYLSAIDKGLIIFVNTLSCPSSPLSWNLPVFCRITSLALESIKWTSLKLHHFLFSTPIKEFSATWPCLEM